MDERAYYHVLRALSDDPEQARAMAAWALGRSGRQDAASYIAPRLNDEWIVAAHAARALRDLGTAGQRELESAAAHDDAVLARQMLWESSAARAPEAMQQLVSVVFNASRSRRSSTSSSSIPSI